MARLRLWNNKPRHARPDPELPRYRPHKRSLLIAVLSALAVVLGFTAAETASHSTGPVSSVSPRAAAGPSPTTGSGDSPTTTTSIPTIIGTVPSTIPVTQPGDIAAPTPVPSPTSPSAASHVVNPPSPQPCTPSELAVSTATDSSNYRPGSDVRVTTELKDLGTPCVFTPVRTGQYECGTSLVVNSSSGNQIWPVQGQSEQCAQPATTVLEPGYSESVSVSWDQQYLAKSSGSEAQAPRGNYQALGRWSWSGPGQRTYTLGADSSPFTIG